MRAPAASSGEERNQVSKEAKQAKNFGSVPATNLSQPASFRDHFKNLTLPNVLNKYEEDGQDHKAINRGGWQNKQTESVLHQVVQPPAV
jgi:hypothetical protein